MVSMSEFLKSQGMDYSVSLEPAPHPIRRDENIRGQFHIVRSTDGEVISPKTVSTEYRAISPAEVASRVDHFMAEGWITPERGFLFHRGSYEVLSFRIDGGSLAEQGKVAGEDWTHFLSLHNHQGGGGKIRGSIHSHRIVCQNTAMMAARMASFAIPHSGKVGENLDLAVSTWNDLKTQIRRISDRVTIWNSASVSATDAAVILSDLYGFKGKDLEDVSARTLNEYEFALSEFNRPERGTFGRSLADVYNAVTSTNTRYLPEKAKENEEKRLASLYALNGTRQVFEGQTVTMLDKLAGIT